MANWLITGGSGFLGRHLLARLAAEAEPGVRVFAAGRRHPGGWPVEDFVRADLNDPDSVGRVVHAACPDVVIHSAGKVPPAPSAALYRANTRITALLVGALRRADRACRVVLAGSAAELGPVPVERLPASEETPCRPSDAYGLSKWAATRIGLAAGAPLEVVVARLFNPIGPGLPPSQAFGRFASLLARAGIDPLILDSGDLDARRDFVDVRDAARALIDLARGGSAGTIYHVGSGVSRTIRDGLDRLIRLSRREVHVRAGSIACRRGPIDSRADIRRIVSHVGWSPEIAFEQSLADLWEDEVRRSITRRVA